MVFERKSAVFAGDSDHWAWDFYPEESSFGTLLDSACERLRERYIKYTIRRIREMDGELERLEKELDELIGLS